MNRFLVALKRVHTKKLYLCLLGLLIGITLVYQCLPIQKTSSMIRVAIYIEDSSSYAKSLRHAISDASSLYEFYYTADKDALILDVQSGYAECGFYVPDSFFESYIAGNSEHTAYLYETPASTLSAAISETFSFYVFQAAAPQLLVHTINDPAMQAELTEAMQAYTDSDSIFQISSVTNSDYVYEDTQYHIPLPIQEFSCLLCLFSALFGWMIYLQDQERSIYLALPTRKIREIKHTTILASLLPVLFVGLLCNAISYGISALLPVLLSAALSYAFTIVLSLFIKHSLTLAKLLPIFLLPALFISLLTYLF